MAYIRPLQIYTLNVHFFYFPNTELLKKKTGIKGKLAYYQLKKDVNLIVGIL